jgi:heme/copper-type cytochrome/quinol oxidase subunit 2
VTSSSTDVMWAFQLTTVGAFIWICSNQRIVRATVVAARRGNFVLLNSHYNGPLD